MSESAETEPHYLKKGCGQAVRGEMLDQISSHESRCFSLERLPDGSFVFWEECDGYFDFPLTAKQLLKLSEELREAAEHTLRDPT